MKSFIIAVVFLAGGAVLASGIDQASTIKDQRQGLRIHQTTPIIYPHSLLGRGITSGQARVALSVDFTGQLTDVLVVGYSHEEFGEAAERAMREWSYEAIRIGQEHVATQALVKFDFEATGVVVSIDASSDVTARLLPFRREKAYGPCPLQKLDMIPTPTAFAEPIYPKDLHLHGVEGEAVLEFYIDENGSVRMPAVVDADFWELGVLAMNAVRQWRFMPPTSQGRPVLVRVRQAFHFSDPTS